MKCGKCKQDHATIDEVKSCYNDHRDKPVAQVVKQERNADNYNAHVWAESAQAAVDTAEPKATEKQVRYLDSLLRQAHAELYTDVDGAVKADTLGKRLASWYIDHMKRYLANEPEYRHLPRGVRFDEGRMSADGDPAGYGDPNEAERVSRNGHGSRESGIGPVVHERYRPPVEIPNGLYATPSITGNNDLDFWRIKNGRVPGVIFVNRVIGGHQDQTIPRDSKARIKTSRIPPVTQTEALKAIVKAGVKESNELAGNELKFCRKCGIHLTDETSRALGIGPVCRDN